MRDIFLLVVVFAVQWKVFIRVMNAFIFGMRDSRKKIFVQVTFSLGMLVVIPALIFIYRHSPTARNIAHLRPANLLEAGIFLYFAVVALLVVHSLFKSAVNLLRPSHVPAEIHSQRSRADLLNPRWRRRPIHDERGLHRWLRFMDDTYRLEIVRIHLLFASLPPAFDGLRIVQLSDLHYSARSKPEYFEACVDAANQLGGDLIVFTGDLITRRKHIPAAARLLSRLHAPLGVYAVRGNHEFWTSPHHCKEVIERIGMILLDNHAHPLERDGRRLWLVGTEHPWKPVADWDQLLERPDGEFQILLSHTPDNVYQAARRRVPLVLSGHTHGGQIRLPGIGSVLVPSHYSRRFDAGLFDCRGTVLYVNRGLGTLPPPIRIHCRPEITEFVLVQDPESAILVSHAKAPSRKEPVRELCLPVILNTDLSV